MSELDRPGYVIGINADDSVGVWLQQRLTAAQLRATPDYTLRDAVQWLQNRDVVAFVGGPQRLVAGTPHLNGKVERVQRTTLEEFWATVNPKTSDVADGWRSGCITTIGSATRVSARLIAD